MGEVVFLPLGDRTHKLPIEGEHRSKIQLIRRIMPSVMPTAAQDDLARTIEQLRRQLSEAHRLEIPKPQGLKANSGSAVNLHGALERLIKTAMLLTAPPH